MAAILTFPARGGMIAAASACVFRGGYVLIVRRARPPFLWSLPGGRVEPGESAQEAALREVLEETGVSARIVAEGLVLDVPGDAGERYEIRNFAACHVSGEARAMSDAAEVAWAQEADLETYALTPRAREAITRARALVNTAGH